MTQSSHAPFPAASSQPQSQPLLGSLPDPAAHPGFALARSWRDQICGSIAEILATTAADPRDDDRDDADDCSDADDETRRDQGGQTGTAAFDDDADADWRDPPMKLSSKPAQQPSETAVSIARHRRELLPLELVLILTLAEAIARRAGQPVGAPAQLALIHGWGQTVSDHIERLLRQDDIAAAMLSPGLEAPQLLRAPQEAPGARAGADRRKTLATQIAGALMKGQPVILLGDAPADLPESLRRLCSEALTLPRPGRALISAALALLYPEGGKGPSGALPDNTLPDDTLPEDTALARLSPLELSAALHAGSHCAVLAALDRLCAPVPQPATGKVSGLDAVAGQPRAIAMLHRLCEDITAWREGQLAWSAVPRSLILHGPPGTGKTLLAQAFAAQAGLPLIATSFADCQKSGHLGDMLASLDGAVAEAANRAPAVFFLDELDGFGRREASDIGKGGTYMRAVITGLLRQIDRLMATEGVVLIGATNDLGAIDPAIRRAGRFDTILPIDPPDRAGMAQILRAHLGAGNDAGSESGKYAGKGIAADPALEQAIASAAEALIGTNGAAAAALARAALARARESRAPLAEALPEALLAECAARHPGVSAADQRRIALHEAGHVLVGVLSGFVPEALRLSGGGGEVRWPLPPYHTRATALAELRMLLAGRAAETVFCAAPSSSAGSGAASDLAQATRLALRIETEWGMGDGGLIWLPELPLGNRSAPWLPTKIADLLAVAERQARALIASHRETVEALAEALLIEREMTGPALAHWSARIRSLQRPARSKPASAPQVSSVIPFEPG